MGFKPFSHSEESELGVAEVATWEGPTEPPVFSTVCMYCWDSSKKMVCGALRIKGILKIDSHDWEKGQGMAKTGVCSRAIPGAFAFPVTFFLSKERRNLENHRVLARW